MQSALRAPGLGRDRARSRGTLVEDFEDGFEARFGERDVTTDEMTGGSSSANVAVRDGALVVTGEIAAGVAFPWAGVIWVPSASSPCSPWTSPGARRSGSGRGAWAGVLGDADRQRGACRAVDYRDVRGLGRVEPGGDSVGGISDGRSGSHCGAGVCGRGAGGKPGVRGG